MAMENTIVVAMFLAALVVVTISVPTATADKIEKTDDILCSKIPATKVGLWGGNEGSEMDIPSPPMLLESVTIISNYSIEAIEFSYYDRTGQRRITSRWGGRGGTAHKIDLARSEIVREISGTYNMFDGETCLTSFKLLTNTRTWGPWAEENGTRFSITAPTGTSIVGFFARGGRYLDAIGVYLNKL